MNRLEDMIARLATQRACINAAVHLVEHLKGPVLEIGLGKGRPYSHLQQLFADREIFAFDRELHALPDARPTGDYLVLGDSRETLLAIADRLNRRAVLAHADFVTDERLVDAALAQDIADPIVRLVSAQGLVLSDRALPHSQLREIDLPNVELPLDIEPWSYFVYRVTKTRQPRDHSASKA